MWRKTEVTDPAVSKPSSYDWHTRGLNQDHGSLPQTRWTTWLNGWFFFFFNYKLWCHFCFCSVTPSYPTVCDTMDCSTPGFLVLHHLPEFTQTHVHWVGDAIQPSHPLLPHSPPAFNLSQHQGLFQWASSLHQVNKLFSFIISPPMNIQGRFPLELTSLISLQSEWTSRVFSSITVWKHQFFGTFFLLGIKRDSIINTKENICDARVHQLIPGSTTYRDLLLKKLKTQSCHVVIDLNKHFTHTHTHTHKGKKTTPKCLITIFKSPQLHWPSGKWKSKPQGDIQVSDLPKGKHKKIPSIWVNVVEQPHSQITGGSINWYF